ncbi:hypothetical protein [Mesorhizobium sp. CA12]|uniref:hypothetical protein n=1 Tax=Mesorhizobium sp. CA12 TaxID=2876644 RepID=UPI001CCEDFEF|nr:hypothetical protein [Mesorhizobium sp. CA12]MBZ9861288.1 hypothetical protein [Mesorhizobium sp. CA12]
MNTNASLRWSTPHPTELRSATFSRKGEGKPTHDSGAELCYAPRFLAADAEIGRKSLILAPP